MKYNRADIVDTLRVAKRLARNCYVYAVLCGFVISYTLPPLGQRYYKVDTTGNVNLVEPGTLKEGEGQ